MVEQAAAGQVQELQASISQATADYEREIFYYCLYHEAPVVVASGKAGSADELLALLVPPDTLTAAELAEAKEIASGIITFFAGAPSTAEGYPELEYPELVAPTGAVSGVPVSLHQLSVEEIIKSLTAPVPPATTMTQAEWEEYLKSKGWADDDIDNELQLQAEELIASWTDTANQLAAFKSGLAEMPTYGPWEVAKLVGTQPGLALLDLANV